MCFTIDPERPFRLLRSAVGIALLVFIAYLFINADVVAGPGRRLRSRPRPCSGWWRPSSSSARPIPCVRRYRGARAGEVGALPGLVLGIGFLLIELSFGEPIVRFLNNHVIQLFRCLPQEDQDRRRRGDQDLGLRAQPQRHEPRSAADPRPPLHRRARHEQCAPVSLAALIAVTAAIVLMSESGTSVVAFFVGALVLALAALSLKVTRTVLDRGMDGRHAPCRSAWRASLRARLASLDVASAGERRGAVLYLEIRG